MKGNTISEFINDLYACGGPEKEFTHNGKRYFLETIMVEGTDLLELYVVEIKDDTDDVVFSFTGKTLHDCVSHFEEAKIFDGKTIYQVEQEIEVLFG
ncbi:MAG: hypothetical protein E7504_06805 [Ruminococcus sp.]|nr:hypothetical protein [Ruminococcus sp.]